MRTLTLALAAATAVAVAPTAFAQMMTSNEGPAGGYGSTIPMGVSNGVYNRHSDTLADRYDLAVMQLKKKVDRVTAEDGGKLTAGHQASLQAELDALNRQFGAKPRVARRASFGRHDAGPGPSTSSSASSD